MTIATSFREATSFVSKVKEGESLKQNDKKKR